MTDLIADDIYFDEKPLIVKTGPYELRKGNTPRSYIVIAPGKRSYFSLMYHDGQLSDSSHAKQLRSNAPHIYAWALAQLGIYASQSVTSEGQNNDRITS